MESIGTYLDLTAKLNPKHYATLLGERKSGSLWGEKMTAEKLASLPWKEYHPSSDEERCLPFCKYFHLTLEDMGDLPEATQRMETLGYCQTKGIPVGISCGKHGLELVSEKIQGRHCDEAWLIVGPAEDADGKELESQEMVWTAYPGELTSSLPKIIWSVDDLSYSCAVKGID